MQIANNLTPAKPGGKNGGTSGYGNRGRTGSSGIRHTLLDVRAAAQPHAQVQPQAVHVTHSFGASGQVWRRPAQSVVRKGAPGPGAPFSSPAFTPLHRYARLVSPKLRKPSCAATLGPPLNLPLPGGEAQPFPPRALPGGEVGLLLKSEQFTSWFHVSAYVKC